ncbi:MAG TPA: hypothetical protein VGO86_08335, partial [Candidatus Dormibacteraeota bacterium]
SWRRWLPAAAATGLLALSVAVQVAGASVRYDTDSVNLAMTASRRSDLDWAAADRVLFDWRYFPILEHVRELRDHRNVARGYRGGVGVPFN